VKLLNQQKNILGIAINDLSVQVVSMSLVDRQYKINFMGRRELPKGLVVGGQVRDIKRVANVLEELLFCMKKSFLKNAKVVCSVPDNSVLLHMFSYPKSLSAKQIESSISFEMARIAPAKLEDVYSDFEIVDAFKGSGRFGSNLPILFIAVPKMVVNSLMKVMGEVDLEVSIFEIEDTALARSLVSPKEKSRRQKSALSFMLLDLGSSHSSVSTYHQGHLFSACNFPVTSASVNNKLAVAMNCSLQEAEKFKVEKGLHALRSDVGYKVLSEMADSICVTLSRAIKYHERSFDGSDQIKSIILNGGLAGMQGLIPYMKKKLGLEIKLATPWLSGGKVISRVKTKECVEAVSGDPREYALAIGLALRGAGSNHFKTSINLLPKKLKKAMEGKMVSDTYKFFSTASMIVLTCILLSFVTVWLDLYLKLYNTKIITNRTERIIYGTKFREITGIVNGYNREVGVLQRIRSKIHPLTPILEDIRNRTPTWINIRQFKYDLEDSSIFMKGIAPKYDDLIQYKENLEKSDNFVEVISPLSNFVKQSDILFEFTLMLPK